MAGANGPLAAGDNGPSVRLRGRAAVPAVRPGDVALMQALLRRTSTADAVQPGDQSLNQGDITSCSTRTFRRHAIVPAP